MLSLLKDLDILNLVLKMKLDLAETILIKIHARESLNI